MLSMLCTLCALGVQGIASERLLSFSQAMRAMHVGAQGI